MAVLINDMEVEVQAPEPVAQGGAANSQNNEVVNKSSLSPTDINTILSRQFERLVRIRAH